MKILKTDQHVDQCLTTDSIKTEISQRGGQKCAGFTHTQISKAIRRVDTHLFAHAFSTFEWKKILIENAIQVSLVIRGRYVPLFWTTIAEFADKKTHFDQKFDILNQFLKCE